MKSPFALSQLNAEVSNKNTNLNYEAALISLAREGVSVNTRKIYIPVIDIEAPMTLYEFIDHIVTYSKEKEKYDPIDLIVSTYGGDSYGMLGLIDVIKTAPMPINTIGVGGVFSAGAWVLAAGTGVRKLHKNAFVMVHQFRGGQDGTMLEIEQTTKHFKQIQKRAEALLAEFTNKDEKYWNVACKKEYYIDAEKAKEIGLVDELIEW